MQILRYMRYIEVSVGGDTKPHTPRQLYSGMIASLALWPTSASHTELSIQVMATTVSERAASGDAKHEDAG